MNEDPTKEMSAARPFEERVLTELAAIRTEVAEIRTEVAEIRVQQIAMAKNIAALDERLTSLEEKVDARLNETRPIWEAIQLAIDRLDEKIRQRHSRPLRGSHGHWPARQEAQGH